MVKTKYNVGGDLRLKLPNVMNETANQLNSFLFVQVAERALLLWNNEHILNLVKQNRQVLLPMVFSALVHNAQNHWNQAVLNLTQNVRKTLTQMDEDLVTACQHKLEEEKSALMATASERQQTTWERLEAAAAASNNSGGGASTGSNGGDIIVAVKPTATCSVACC